mmetsp:Transcript_16753/g.43343  ORF Transcript_16753/g.43343 Transcript_16753/m.43343 type:complete len:149 (-) Transcript_16753:361-807(-)
METKPATTRDDLRTQMSQLKHATAHPVESIEQSWRERELDSKLTMLGQVYGAHVPMRKRMEAQIVSRAGRLPGLASSNLGLEVLMNTHEDMEFDDFLGEPAFVTEGVDVHLAMEKRLGMNRVHGNPPSALPHAVDGSLSAHRAVARGI